VLKALKPDIVLGTKFRLKGADRSRVRQAIEQAVDESLKRLQRDNVDLLQLHNPLVAKDADDKLAIDNRLSEVVPAMQALQKAGKTRFIGSAASAKRPPCCAPSSRRRSIPCRSSTTPSIPAPAGRCPRARRVRITAACSNAPRPSTWARS
jgi:hypothetical protein